MARQQEDVLDAQVARLDAQRRAAELAFASGLRSDPPAYRAGLTLPLARSLAELRHWMAGEAAPWAAASMAELSAMAGAQPAMWQWLRASAAPIGVGPAPDTLVRRALLAVAREVHPGRRSARFEALLAAPAAEAAWAAAGALSDAAAQLAGGVPRLWFAERVGSPAGETVPERIALGLLRAPLAELARMGASRWLPLDRPVHAADVVAVAFVPWLEESWPGSSMVASLERLSADGGWQNAQPAWLDGAPSGEPSHFGWGGITTSAPVVAVPTRGMGGPHGFCRIAQATVRAVAGRAASPDEGWARRGLAAEAAMAVGEGLAAVVAYHPKAVERYGGVRITPDMCRELAAARLFRWAWRLARAVARHVVLLHGASERARSEVGEVAEIFGFPGEGGWLFLHPLDPGGRVPARAELARAATRIAARLEQTYDEEWWRIEGAMQDALSAARSAQFGAKAPPAPSVAELTEVLVASALG